MQKIIIHIPVLYNSWRVSLIAFVISYPAIGIMYFFSLFNSSPTSLPIIIFVTAPLTTAIIVYLITIISCLVYNLFSKIIGGIKIEVSSNEKA